MRSVDKVSGPVYELYQRTESATVSDIAGVYSELYQRTKSATVFAESVSVSAISGSDEVPQSRTFLGEERKTTDGEKTNSQEDK